MSDIVVVGGGLTGIFGCFHLNEKYPNKKIHLVEASNRLGGLFHSFEYGDRGFFDMGMHNLYETGVEEVDKIIWSFYPQKQWHLLEGNKRDLCGLFWNGKIYKGSPYIDLRKQADRDEIVKSLFEELDPGRKKGAGESGAINYLNAHFGKYLQKNYFREIVEKIFQEKLENLTDFSCKMIPLNRIVLFDEDIVDNLSDSEFLRSKLGFPEQRQLPEKRQGGKVGLYPKKYGCAHIVNYCHDRLKEMGVEIHLGSAASGIQLNGDLISQLEITKSDGHKIQIDADQLVWTSGPIPLAKLLDPSFVPKFKDKPLNTYIVSMALTHPPSSVGDLYYLYCYSPGFLTFRTTFYYNYCEDFSLTGGFPISSELLTTEEVSEDQITQCAIEELLNMGVIQNAGEVDFIKSERLPYGFPRPTTANMEAFTQARQTVESNSPKNLISGGVLSSPNLFFQGDVMRNLYEKLNG